MLAYFFWTAAEAFFLFLKLVKVQRGSMNAYVYVAMAICWGKPLYNDLNNYYYGIDIHVSIYPAVPVAIVAISLVGYQYYLNKSL